MLFPAAVVCCKESQHAHHTSLTETKAESERADRRANVQACISLSLSLSHSPRYRSVTHTNEIEDFHDTKSAEHFLVFGGYFLADARPPTVVVFVAILRCRKCPDRRLIVLVVGTPEEHLLGIGGHRSRQMGSKRRETERGYRHRAT